ncbi:hypothetical protein [Pseudomonas trivialis]|uniref:hypothetical protein n=1 Tax=Pseudomonas trivialis TaxID=200450 RepID=UPI0030D25A9C
MVDTKKRYEPVNHGPIKVQLAQLSRLRRWPGADELNSIHTFQTTTDCPLWRAGLPRVGLRSSPKTRHRGVPETAHSSLPGLLRSPTRASPLATEALAADVRHQVDIIVAFLATGSLQQTLKPGPSPSIKSMSPTNQGLMK